MQLLIIAGIRVTPCQQKGPLSYIHQSDSAQIKPNQSNGISLNLGMIFVHLAR